MAAAAEKSSSRASATVAALSASALLQWCGASAILPLVTLYLRGKGASPAEVGVAIASYFVAALIVQYPLGWASDRLGRRPLLLGGLFVYAAASFSFLLFSGPLAVIAIRALQGAGSGTVDVAAAAEIGSTVPEDRRGRSFGTYFGARTAGLVIGPFVATVASPDSMSRIFAAAGALVLLASIPVFLVVPGGRGTVAAAEKTSLDAGGRQSLRGRASGEPPWKNRAVLGVAVVLAAVGLIGGIYEVCWSLLLHLRGATAWEIGLSWTLFAAPFVVASYPAGWLADHSDRTLLVVVSLVGTAGFAALYPFLDSIGLLVGLGVVEAAFVALTFPAVLSRLADSVGTGELGRAQGFVSSVETAATAVAALGAGAMFGVAAALPFLVAAGCVLAAAAALPWFWGKSPARSGPGREGKAVDGSLACLALDAAPGADSIVVTSASTVGPEVRTR